MPIPGVKTRPRLEENAQTGNGNVSAQDLARIESAIGAAAGERYTAAGMQTVGR